MKFVASNKNEFVIKGLKNLDNKMKQEIRKSLYKSGLDIAGTANNVNSGLIKQEMNKPKSGRKYKKYKGIGGRRLSKPAFHTSSADGESPAVVTGELRKSVYFRVHSWDRVAIGATAKHAKPLEEGTKRIKKKNFIKGPILKSRGRIINNLKGITRK